MKHKTKMENKRHHNSLLIIFLFKPLKLLINVKNEKLISLLLDLILNSIKAFLKQEIMSKLTVLSICLRYFFM